MSPREVLQELLGDLWVEPQCLLLEGQLGEPASQRCRVLAAPCCRRPCRCCCQVAG
jgi:hypothetical protein